MASLSVSERVSESATAELHLCLLGPPSLAWQGEPLMLPRRQARALLFYLAAVPQPVSRDHLCLLFWPDATETTARCNLSRLVSILHSALPDPALLITSADQIGLARQRTWSDTQAFEQLWAAWKDDGQPSCLQQAVALYRGSFLDGFSLPDNPEYESWMTMERQRCERMVLQALAALVEDEASKGEYASAIVQAQHYLEIDNLSEEIHRRLIELYALTGDRAAAVRQYERLVAVLERELGLDPLPETQTIFRAVQAGGMPQRIGPTPSSFKVHMPFPDVPLVGREEAWHALEEAYSRTRSGRGLVVLISGEAGIGKSRLLRDFCTSVQHQCILLTGAGYPETQTSPYQPIVEALRSGLSMELFGLDAYPGWLSEASRLLPELRARHPGLPEPPASEPGWARARLFESLEMILAGMAAGVRPVLICLDDLHWGDPATLDWLAYMGHHLATRRLMILGVYRSEEAATVAELRNRLARQGVLREVLLAGLDETSVYRLLCRFDADFCGRSALTGRMCTAAGGNPFFLLETARALIESGQRLGHALSPEDIMLPDSVRSAVQARISRLSPTARQLLEAAAVLGTIFDFDAARLTSGRQENEAVDALEELLSRQLVVAHNGGYRFRHELTREAIYLDLSYQRRRLLHRRAGETLERLRPTDAATLARHLELADQPGRAARYALQAGLAARAVYAQVEARQWSDRALGLLEREASSLRDPQAITGNLRARVEALNLRGWVLRLIGDMATYARDLQEEGRLAARLGDGRASAHLRQRQAYVHRWFCRYAQALELAEEGLRLSQAAGDRWLEGMCWREVGLAARALGDYGRAQSALQRALNLLDAPEHVGLRVHVLGNLSTLHLYEGNFRPALDLAQQALALCEQAQLQLERRVALGDIGAAAVALGDRELARCCLAESLAMARKVSDRTQEILCLGHLGRLEVQEGQATAAIEHLAAALALAEEINSRAEQSWLHAGIAQALVLAGERTQALAHAQRAMALAKASGCANDQKLSGETLEKLR
jgi:DNA-binding SARP family transcriptional activator